MMNVDVAVSEHDADVRDREVAVSDRAGVIAVAVDRDGAIVDWTNEFCDMTGRAPETLRGSSLWELVLPSDRSRLRGVMTSVAIDRKSRRVDAVIVEGSKNRRIAWSCSFAARSGVDSVVAWGIDITATVASVEDKLRGELAARERELSAIYARVPGILFSVGIEPDGEFRFLSMSDAGMVATGEKFVGSLVRDVIPPPSRDLVLDRYREAIRTGQTVRWDETSQYPAGVRHAHVAVTPLYDADGVATRLIGIVHDVTERHAAT